MKMTEGSIKENDYPKQLGGKRVKKEEMCTQ